MLPVSQSQSPTHCYFVSVGSQGGGDLAADIICVIRSYYWKLYQALLSLKAGINKHGIKKDIDLKSHRRTLAEESR